MIREYCILYRECPAYDSTTCLNQEFRGRCRRLEEVFTKPKLEDKETKQQEPKKHENL